MLDTSTAAPSKNKKHAASGVTLRQKLPGLKVFTHVLAAVVTFMLAHAAYAQAAARHEIKIESQSVATALKALAAQTGLQVLVMSDDAGDKQAPAVFGNMTNEEALTKILHDTGLTFQKIDDNTVAIKSATAARPSADAKPEQISWQAPPTDSPESQSASSPALQGSGAAGRAAEATGANGAAALDEITVTANKLGAQRLQDAPMSIEALSGEMLKNLGATNFSDWSRDIPGLVFQDRGPGDKRYIIRGVNSTGTGTVGVYYDEAVITGSNKEDGGGRNVDIKLYDIGHIEVLKGPQGTLYGANSLSGTIRIITNKPDPTKFEGNISDKVSGTSHGGLNNEVNGMINVPLVQDKLALRAVGWSVNNSGYVDNIRLHDDRDNNERTDGARLAVRAIPAENLNITLSATLQNTHTGSPSFYEPTAGVLKTEEFARDPWDDQTRIYSGVLAYDTDLGTLTVATDSFRRKINYWQDVTRFFAGLFGIPAEQCCLGLGPEATVQPQTRDLWDSEVRFSSKLNGPAQFVVGAFHELDKKDFDSGSVVVDPATGRPIEPYAYSFRRHASQRTTQSAVFSEVTYDATDKLQFVGGLRYFWSSLYGDGESLVGFPFAPPTPADPPVTAENHKLTEKLSASYKITPDAMIYATASEGFRIGGVNDPGITLVPNLPSGFGPDEVRMIELGAKTAWLANRLILNASAYTMRWSNMQNRTLDRSGFVFTTNAGQARIDGVELDIVARPINGLSFTVGATYSDPRLTTDQPLLSQTDYTGKSGDRIPNVPKITASFITQYDWTMTDTVDGFAVLNTVYTGSSSIAFRPDDPNNRHLGGYALTDLRIGGRRDHWEVALSASNIFNAVPTVDIAIAAAGYEQVFTARPRTVGLSAAYHF